MALKFTATEIDSKKTKRGGWTRKTLADWGIPWPPIHGWRQALLKGEEIPKRNDAIAQHLQEVRQFDLKWREDIEA